MEIDRGTRVGRPRMGRYHAVSKRRRGRAPHGIRTRRMKSTKDPRLGSASCGVGPRAARPDRTTLRWWGGSVGLGLVLSLAACLVDDDQHCANQLPLQGHAWCAEHEAERSLCSRCVPSSNGHGGCVIREPRDECLVGELRASSEDGSSGDLDTTMTVGSSSTTSGAGSSESGVGMESSAGARRSGELERQAATWDFER